MPTKHQYNNQLDPGSSNHYDNDKHETNYEERGRLGQIGRRECGTEKGGTTCTRTRCSQGREVKLDRRIEHAGDSRVTAMNTTINHILNKRNALWG